MIYKPEIRYPIALSRDDIEIIQVGIDRSSWNLSWEDKAKALKERLQAELEKVDE